MSDGVRKALSGIQLNGYTVIAGLGGRAITRASLRQLFEDAGNDELFELDADPAEALDLFHHPYAHAARRGYVPLLAAEPVAA